MNVLFIGTTDILGGAAKVSWELKAALEKAGHQTSMFVADKRSNEPSVRIIPRQTWRKYLGFLLSTERLIATDWILKTKEYQEADIIHCHNLHGRFFNLETLQKMSTEKPVVWTLHDEWAITPHCAYTLEGEKLANGLYACPSIDTPPRLLWDNSPALSRWKIDIYKRSALTLVSPSHWLLKRVRRTPLGRHKLYHIPNGIDTSHFVRSDKWEARDRLGLPADKKIVLFLANDAKNNTWKGWKFTEALIRNFDREDILFLSVGNLSDHVAESHVWHRGQVKDPDVLALYYSAADVLLFTSIAENFPLVILEAMSCGVPIVTFDVGGVGEVVTNGENGIVVGYQDTEALHQALTDILALTPEEQAAMTAKSIDKMHRYDLPHMTTAYLRLYETVLNRHEKITTNKTHQ